MTPINLFPAVLLAGSPHTGKSVLAYHISKHLKNTLTPFILLRTTPDGEGDWFLEAERGVGIILRQKKNFTQKLVARAEKAIRHRQLPMLVDAGGKPRGNQFRIFQACTHVILLYHDQEDRTQWQTWLEQTSLIPIAILRSDLHGEDVITSESSPLTGVISGLDRTSARLGTTFERTLTLVQGIFDYPQHQIQTQHLQSAPANAETILVDQLAQHLGVGRDERGYWWEPRHLPQMLELLPDSAIALYGRGPAWLYAAAAIAALPHHFYMFDARHFGWMNLPPVKMNAPHAHPDLAFSLETDAMGVRLKIHPRARFLNPDPILLPQLPTASAIILDGKAPLWLFASLARALAPHYRRIFINDPRRPPVLVSNL